MKFSRKTAILTLSAVMTMASLSVSKAFAEDISVRRIDGNNRYETALNLSKNDFSKAKYVTVASGENYPDALIGGTFTSQTKTPMLLTGRDSLPSGVIEEINRLSPEKVFVLGGESSISKEVFNKIKSSTSADVERIAGKNRFETAEKIDNLRFRISKLSNGSKVHGDIYAGVDGNNFPDALVASPFVGIMSDKGVLTYLYPNKSKNHADLPYLYLFGGKDSVPESKYAQAQRFSGRNRYETAANVAEAYKKYVKNNVDKVILVNGESYPDALCSSSISGLYNAPVLLTPSGNLDKSASDFIKNSNIKNVIVVGGKISVSQNVIEQIK